MRYAIVIEKAQGNYSAYVPDLPGCITTGKTLAEVEKNMTEAIAFHLEGLQQEGLQPSKQRLGQIEWLKSSNEASFNSQF